MSYNVKFSLYPWGSQNLKGKVSICKNNCKKKLPEKLKQLWLLLMETTTGKKLAQVSGLLLDLQKQATPNLSEQQQSPMALLTLTIGSPDSSIMICARSRI